jgi:hypothetical protein
MFVTPSSSCNDGMNAGDISVVVSKFCRWSELSSADDCWSDVAFLALLVLLLLLRWSCRLLPNRRMLPTLRGAECEEPIFYLRSIIDAVSRRVAQLSFCPVPFFGISDKKRWEPRRIILNPQRSNAATDQRGGRVDGSSGRWSNSLKRVRRRSLVSL